MKSTFFARRALLILCIILFLTPFAMRGARFAVQGMKNNVKHWLPSDFPETADLEWFGKHFMGEQFVIITWPGCSDDDPRFHKLVEKLRGEVAPPEPVGGPTPEGETVDAPTDKQPFEKLTDAQRDELDRLRARELGDRLGLSVVGDDHENWGARGEKWLKGHNDRWYFITPEGELCRWSGNSQLPGYLARIFRRGVLDDKLARGKVVATFGRPATEDCPNEFHEDPHKLTARLFKSITTGPGVLEELSKKGGPFLPLGVDDEHATEEAKAKALERLTGSLFGADGKLTCIMLTLSDPGKRDLKRVIGRPLLGRARGRLLELACVDCGIPEEDVKLGGPPVDNVAIDEEGQITLARLIGYSALVGLAISFICFRSIKITLMIFFVGGVSAITSLGLVWWTGGSVDAIVMSMPSLVYVLGLSGAVHIVNYYRDAVEENGLEGGPERALAHGWKPCTFAALTTALGLISLNTSNLIPIQKFGRYSAIGVLATLVLLFTFLPSALQLWPPRFDKRRKRDKPAKRFEIQKALLSFWEPVGGFVVRRYGWVTLVCAVVFIVGVFGLGKTETTVHLIKLFDSKSKIIQDYAWLESNLGKLVPMEVVVRVQPEMMRRPIQEQDADEDGAEPDPDERFRLDFLARMEIADRIHKLLEGTFGEEGQGEVGRGISAPTFAPDLLGPSFASVTNPGRWAMNGELEDNRHEYLASDYLRIDTEAAHEGSELWRISLRLNALMDIDYGRFVHQLERVVEPVLAAYHSRHQILREIDQQREGRGFVKSRVAFLGVPRPSQSDRETEESEDPSRPVSADNPTDTGHAEPASDDEYPIDQTKIFSDTLRDLMKCAGVNHRVPERLCWHDPDAADAEEGYYTSEKWRNALSKAFDCVVLVRDNEAYDVDFIKQHAKSFIDARDHLYDPSPPEAKTACDQGHLIHAVYTGVVPIVYKAQRTLLVSLVESIGWAFVMIAVVMMFVLRSGRCRPLNLVNARGGLLSMIPNVFPVVIIFGAMGHMKIDVDIGTMMTASVAMGVAVDDTIHFLIWFRDAIARGFSRQQAIIEAYRRCAPAMTQTTLIGGLGLAVFAFSTFTPTQWFGVMMLILLVAALVGDLIFLPALLAGPLGRYFCPRPSAAHSKPTAGNSDRTTSPIPDADGGPKRASGGPVGSEAGTPHITDAPKRSRERLFFRKDQGHDRFKR